jgi:hypothetical protein
VKSLPAEHPPQFSDCSTPEGVAEFALPSELAPPQACSQSSPPDQAAAHRKKVRPPVALLASAALHGAALLLLSWVLFPLGGERPLAWLQGSFQDELDRIDLELESLSGGQLLSPQQQTIDLAVTENLADTRVVEPAMIAPPTTTLPAAQLASQTDSMRQPLASPGGGYAGRQAGNRHSLALSGGGSAASESAVERGLAWLAAHQWDDGSWRFNLQECPQCAGACRHSGVRNSTTDSTGLALLCFLGAGYTQQQGPYQETVSGGLYYLQQQMLLSQEGGDLRDRSLLGTQGTLGTFAQTDGDMYAHGIATLALCEAYAMTQDRTLAGPAQEAIDFIVNAQHVQGGGWRYEPREPGDLSVTGWQLAALKSGVHGKRKIPREVWYRAMDFLDSVQESRGAEYGYQIPEKNKRSLSVVGLFARMMLGWPHDHPPLLKGIAAIGDQDPRQNHMYFNYYASQVLRHHGGSAWKRWNVRMRDYLVERQATAGHETGSWYIDENWSERGGRLYTTTMAILTLEVYYRYMPMYQEAFLEDAP